MFLSSLHVAHRILLESSRNRRVLLMWGLFPTLMLLLFGWVGVDDASELGPSFTMRAPGILIGAALFFSCLAGPISILVGERERNTLRRVLLTPLDGGGYFLGIVWAHVVIALIQTAVVYGITYGVGGGFEGSLALGIFIVVLSVMAYVGVGFFLGAKLVGSTEDVNGPVAAIGVPLLVLGGTFFSPDLLPTFLYTVGQANPIFHMNEALKTVGRGAGGFDEISVHIGALCAFAVAAVILGSYSYRQMLQNELRT